MKRKQLRDNKRSNSKLLALKKIILNRRLLFRAYRKRHELISRKPFSKEVRRGEVICFSTVRNEKNRLPFFLKHYRELGIRQFCFIDNNSTDGTLEYLCEQPDGAVWISSHGYRASRFGTDWLNYLLNKYARNQWVLIVDADEVLIYPEWGDVSISELTEKICSKNQRALAADLIDLYPHARLNYSPAGQSENPIETLPWFDGYGFWVQKQKKIESLRLQGGARARFFFNNQPELAPTLNKTPLVFWRRGYALLNSTHVLLPESLNQVWKHKISGALLHTKFLPGAPERARVEKERDQHFYNGERYRAYYENVEAAPNLWTKDSIRFQGWKQLVDLGIMKNTSD
jgi:glycosyltransferase involved in cell wall biosynthesis